MAGLPTIKRISREDYKDAPGWLDRFIFVLNEWMDSLYNALNRNLTFGDNIRSEIKTMQITAGATADLNTFKFTLKNNFYVQGLILLSAKDLAASYTIITAAPQIGSWRYADGMVYVDSIAGLTNGHNYNITVLAI
jgi:hypothetical protein